MTDYSKLSDAEIAELVCRKLGWGKPDSGKDITVWLIERLDLPDICRSTFIYNWERPKDHVCAEIACFDWPAPIMMQKVKEWLVEKFIKEGRQLCVCECTEVLSDDLVENTFKIFELKIDGEDIRVKGPRALYEAFLQVGE